MESLPNLSDLMGTPHFNSSTNSLIDEFYIPALSRAQRYDRGVGYFTSGWLRMAATGLVKLAENGGIARFIASPKLSQQDWAALNQGICAKEDEILHNSLVKTLEELKEELNRDTLSALAWMIADNLLDFRIALPTAELDGDFHDKFGQFYDTAGNIIAFNGSPNDSLKASSNYESISCFYSWIDDREKMRVDAECQRFERLWTNRDANVRTYRLPDAIRKNLVEFTEHCERPYKAPKTKQSNKASEDHKWRHQKAALAAFLEHKFGVLEMATGTGKTRTALKIIAELLDRELIDTVVITMSGNDLLDQWQNEMLRFERLALYKSYSNHHEQLGFLNDLKGSVLLTSRQQLSIVASKLTTETLERSLIICDEVHGMGSASMVRDLQNKIKPFAFRLGLSATPDREYDEAGNSFIESEIGPVIFRFSLEDAIKRGILCELDYVPLAYELSDDDRAQIKALFAAYHARLASGESMSSEQLYQSISSVRKGSLTKLPPFAEYLNSHPEIIERCLIFVDSMAYGKSVQQLVLPITGKFHTYYGSDDRAELEKFAKGQTECLITCHRISEGIDIRSVNNVVLFSSARAKLETIQRLGRCLRIDPENPHKRALVLDFVELDESDADAEDQKISADQERYDWFQALAAITQELDISSKS